MVPNAVVGSERGVVGVDGVGVGKESGGVTAAVAGVSRAVSQVLVGEPRAVRVVSSSEFTGEALATFGNVFASTSIFASTSAFGDVFVSAFAVVNLTGSGVISEAANELLSGVPEFAARMITLAPANASIECC